MQITPAVRATRITATKGNETYQYTPAIVTTKRYPPRSKRIRAERGRSGSSRLIEASVTADSTSPVANMSTRPTSHSPTAAAIHRHHRQKSAREPRPASRNASTFPGGRPSASLPGSRALRPASRGWLRRWPQRSAFPSARVRVRRQLAGCRFNGRPIVGLQGDRGFENEVVGIGPLSRRPGSQAPSPSA